VRVPLLLQLGALSQVVPLAAAAFARRRLSGARAWVLVWCALLVCCDGLAATMAARHQTNLFVINLFTPAGVAVVLWALSSWQAGNGARRALRLAIVPFLLTWAVLTLAFHEMQTFSSVADPLSNLVALGAAAFTLVARSHHAEGPLLRQDWLWIVGGMALYFGSATAQGPLSALLVRQAPELVTRAYEFKSVLDIIAFLAIARGVTCPVAPRARARARG